MKGVILHGGRGTRLRPLTHTGPKQLIPIANKPMSQYALEDLVEAGITEIAIILGDIAPEKVVEYYGDGSRFGAKITYIEQGEPKGIAHAVGLARDFIANEPFIVYLGDNLIRNGIIGLVDDFRRLTPECQMLLCEVRNPSAFGVAELRGHRVVRLVEKPASPPSNMALVGVYMFRSSIFKAIERLKPSGRGELEITEAIQWLIDAGYDVRSQIVSGWWKDTGKPEDVLEANQLILSDLTPYNHGTTGERAVVTGRVGIGHGTVIEPDCVLRGPIIIGEKCRIGSKTYIGPYTSIGDNVTIQGCEIENSIVAGDTTVRCGGKIVDSLIGRNCQILSSADTLPNGHKLIIGENTFVSL